MFTKKLWFDSIQLFFKKYKFYNDLLNYERNRHKNDEIQAGFEKQIIVIINFLKDNPFLKNSLLPIKE